MNFPVKQSSCWQFCPQFSMLLKMDKKVWIFEFLFDHHIRHRNFDSKIEKIRSRDWWILEKTDYTISIWIIIHSSFHIVKSIFVKIHQTRDRICSFRNSNFSESRGINFESNQWGLGSNLKRWRAWDFGIIMKIFSD